MKTLKIEIPKGYEIKKIDTSTGEVKFQKKAAQRIERISTFEEVCEEMGEDPEKYNYHLHQTVPLNEYAMLQYERLLLIAKCFQEGVELNLYDRNQRKWYPWFSASGDAGFRFHDSDFTYSHSRAALGPLLQFPDKETSDYVGKTFLKEYQRLAELSNHQNQ